MSKEHKDALAQGRFEARSIKAYLNALDAREPGRPMTRESLEKRMARINERLGAEDDPLKRLDLVQSKVDIEHALRTAGTGPRLEELETGFVKHAKSYSERKGIGYSTWRQFGVPAAMLRRAGIPETRHRSKS